MPSDPASQGRRLFDALATRQVRPRASTMMRDLFGRSARDKNAPDTKAAAAALGVSRRTAQRWAKEGLPKKSQAAAKLADQWQNSPAGRKRRIDPNAKRTVSQGGFLGGHVQAAVTISNDRRNGRMRGFTFSLDSEDGTAMMNAMSAGDDAAAYNSFLDGVSKGFGGSVDLDIGDIKWDG